MGQSDVLQNKAAKRNSKYNSKLAYALFAAIIFLVLLGLVVFFVWGVGPSYARNISSIETSTQQMGGVSSTNYLPVLAPGVLWDDLSDAERVGTARYAIKESITKAAEGNIQSYSVIAFYPDNSAPLFLYSSGSDVFSVYSGDEITSVSLRE